jgi:RimJ/RimL family protein N-acetyltransferase
MTGNLSMHTPTNFGGIRGAGKQALTKLGVHAVSTWVVDGNPSERTVADRLWFSFISRQRQCHYIDGRLYDRLWFDLPASEYKEL